MDKKTRNILIVIVVMIIFTLLIVWGAGALGGGSASVTGSVVYRERIALTDDAVVKTIIEDVSIMDVAAEVMGEQIITNPGQVPIPYDVAYNPDEIIDNHTYSVRVRIEDSTGKLLFISDTTYPVITNGITEDVEVLVVKVGE